jgi:3-deoxy-manno-octulosonate cytidylyltransferase (CMP-KDO synthetase)
MRVPPPELSRVELVVLDVDGVMTDGTLRYGLEGELEKTFHVRDGLGIRRLLERGIEVVVVTGRGNAALARRMSELGVKHLVTGRDDKLAAAAELIAGLGVDFDRIACVGDDVLDLPLMERAAVAIAPADAHPAVLARADWITRAGGGRGVVREVADAICAGPATGFRVVIPARYGSTRLPAKPLLPLAGRPMIAHVVDRARESGAGEVLVATDDDRIHEAAAAAGAVVVMTSPDHASGTDRLAEVADIREWPDDAVVVNLQGDEPAMPGALVAAVAGALRANPDAGIATLATPIRDLGDLLDPNVVKVVLSDADRALYFSRAPIPWVRGGFGDELPDGVPFLRHLGLYAYRAGVLRLLAAEPSRPVEQAESLEQLRALALGLAIHVTVVHEAPGHGVDTEADLARVERELAGQE